MPTPSPARATLAAAFAADRARWLGVLLALLGAVDSVYLTYIKYANAPVFCSGVGDCESVNNSVYSQVGGVPIALFGLGAYLLIAALLSAENRLPVLRAYGPLAVFGLALTGTLYSAYLTYVELFILRAVCPYCVISAILITGIFILALVRLRRSLAVGAE
ncbi:MAG: vitamin K epoxide reductase family protein [Anaerolineales bacterium]|nr:vitamin K epoxide reductase family protein [Anaerolineales bacterium]